MSTAYYFSPETLKHNPPPREVSIGKDRIRLGESFLGNSLLTSQLHEVLLITGAMPLMRQITPKPIDRTLLETVHDAKYLETLHKACVLGDGSSKWPDVSTATWASALLTCGAMADAASRVLTGELRTAVVNGRPSGHHATRDDGMGSCYLNDLACGAESAKAAGASRVMIVDWDAHTGNGAEAIFWDRDDVIAVSIHQESWYPENSGATEMVGGPEARGRTVNVPLPAATADAGYAAAIDSVVRPIAQDFEPDVIIVAAGQDPSFCDPQSRMLVSMHGFRTMAAKVRNLADAVCDGRLICSFQGGYSQSYAPLCGLAVVEGLLGSDGTQDPLEGEPEWLVTQRPISDDAAEAIEEVRVVQSRFWQSLGHSDEST